jgi:hypothetical protein
VLRRPNAPSWKNLLCWYVSHPEYAGEPLLVA